MNEIARNESAVSVFGVSGRAFGVVADSGKGRILNQKIVLGPRTIGKNESMTVELRFDDSCGNGHETFAITGEIRDTRYRGDRGFISCGCLHDDIAKHFPELAHLVKWHLVSTDGPMHYTANTIYHAKEHGPTHAFVYYTGSIDPLKVAETKERLVGYEKASKARECEGKPGYRVEWDAKTAKVRNLDCARSSAVWPDATDADLMQDANALKCALLARRPALLERFKADMLEIGFVWPDEFARHRVAVV